MTTAWQLQLRPGSFRGVKFYVDRHEYEGGRRIADHVFPYRDEPWTEDFGRAQRVYQLNLYVLGDDYMPLRDALMDAFEKEGPGILVHPYLGEKTVEPRNYRLSENKDDGGMALFSITFKETSRIAAPDSAANFLDQAKAASNAVQLAVKRAFSAFNSPNPTSFIFDSATALVNSASAVLYTAANGVPPQANGIADLSYAIRNLKGNSRALISAPGKLADNVLGAIKLLTATLNIDGLLPEDANGRVLVQGQNLAAAAKAGYTVRSVFVPLIAFGDGLPQTLNTTDSRILEAENQNLMRQLVVGAALGEAVVASVGTSYSTIDDALTQRDYLVGNIEALMLDPTLSDDVYDSLQNLMAVTVDGIPDPENDFPRITKITLTDTTPSLIICYALYENLLSESDIIERNQISNPAFISPLKPVEVLTGD